MSLPSLDAHTSAIVALLAAGGLRTGDGERPAGAGWQGAEGASEFRAYCIVYPLGVSMFGPLTDISDDVSGEWQITSISRDRHGAQLVADHARSTLIDGWRGLTIAGRKVDPITHAGGGDVRRDDSTVGPLFYAVDRYRISTTPS